MSLRPTLAFALFGFAGGLALSWALNHRSERSDLGTKPRNNLRSTESSGHGVEKTFPPPEAQLATRLAEALASPDPRERYAAFHEAVAAAAAEDFRSLNAGLWKGLPGRDAWILGSILAEHWSEKDPAGALASLAQMRSADRPVDFQAILRPWARIDPEAALAAARSLPLPQDRAAASRAVMVGLTEVDPVRALDLLERTGESLVNRNSLRRSAYSAIARLDPGEALRRVETIPEINARNSTRSAVLREWAKQDPQSAADWVAGLNSGRTKSMVIGGIAREWILSEPDGLAAYLRGLPESPMKARAVTSATRAASDLRLMDLPGLLDWTESVASGSSLAQALYLLLHDTCQENPASSAPYLDSVTNDKTRRSLIRLTALNWQQRDAAAATAWAGSLGDPRERAAATGGILESLARSDPAGAAGLLFSLPVGEREEVGSLGVIREVTRSWAGTDAEGALAFGMDLENGTERDSFLGGVFRQWVHNDRPAAQAFTEKVDDPATATQLQVHLVEAWSHRQPPEATVYAMGIVDPEARSTAVGKAVMNWDGRDSTAAAAFVDALETGPVRETAVEVLVSRMRYRDPPAALELALSLEDPGRRRASVEQVFDAWLEKDPEAAKAAEHRLPGADK